MLVGEELIPLSKSKEKTFLGEEFYLFDIARLAYAGYDSYPHNRLFNWLIELWIMLLFYKEHDRLFYIPFQKIISSEEKHLDTASIKG